MQQPATANTRTRAIGALLLMTLIWGYNWVVMKQVLRFVDPFDFSALRTLLGTVALFALLALLRRPLRPGAIAPLVLLGLLQTAAFTALIQWALTTGGAGRTAVLVYTMPFWLLPLAWFTLGERIRGLQWLALVAAAGGLLMILQPWENGGSLASQALAVGAGLVWALATILAKRLRASGGFDLLSLTAWQMLFGALALCLIAALDTAGRPIEPSPYFFAALAYNALFATALAWLLWLYVLQHLPANLAGLSSLGIPVIGVLAGWLELGERPGALELGGMLMIGTALSLHLMPKLLGARRPPR